MVNGNAKAKRKATFFIPHDKNYFSMVPEICVSHDIFNYKALTPHEFITNHDSRMILHATCVIAINGHNPLMK